MVLCEPLKSCPVGRTRLACVPLHEFPNVEIRTAVEFEYLLRGLRICPPPGFGMFRHRIRTQTLKTRISTHPGEGGQIIQIVVGYEYWVEPGEGIIRGRR